MKNQKGQGLIEYLIIVGIVAIGSIGLISLVGANINRKFTNIIRGLAGESSVELQGEKVESHLYEKRDLGNFLRGAGGSKNQNHSNSDQKEKP